MCLSFPFCECVYRDGKIVFIKLNIIFSIFLNFILPLNTVQPMEQIYFKNNFVDIYFNKDLSLGKAIWKGDLIGAEYKEAVLLCLDLIDRHGLIGWLGDNRKMKSIRPDDLEWSVKVFLPRLLESSLLRLANLPSENEQNRAAVETIYNKTNISDTELTVRSFMSEEEAEAWLKELALQQEARSAE